MVAVTQTGEIFLNRDRATLEDLGQKIKNMLKDKQAADQVVYIKSDKLAKYGAVVEVIDKVREAGFERIGLVSEKEQEKGGGGGS